MITVGVVLGIWLSESIRNRRAVGLATFCPGREGWHRMGRQPGLALNFSLASRKGFVPSENTRPDWATRPRSFKVVVVDPFESGSG